MDYSDLFTRAWRICWNNKYIFVLGFLAALGSGGSGGGQGFNANFSGGELPPGVLENADRILALMGPILAVLACVGLVLGLVLWLIRLVAQAGLISTAARLDRGEKSSLGQSFSAGTAHLPRFLGLNILIYLPFWIIGIVSIALGIFAFGAAAASVLAGNGGPELGALPAGFGLLGLCAVGLICLLAPLYLLATIIYAFGQRGIVLQDMGVTQSIGHGWRFVRNNAGEIVLLIVFLIVLSMIFGALVSAVMIPLSLLTFGPVFLDLFRGVPLQTVDIVFAAGGLILLGLLGALLNSVLIAYRSVTVTLAYQDLLGKPGDKMARQEL